MPTSYPGGTDSLTNPIGTQTLDTPDHAAQHGNANDAIEAIQSASGTHSGTNVLKNFVAGQFPVRNTGGGATGTLVQTLVGGTLQNSFIGTSTITGGTAKSMTLGTPTLNYPYKARAYLGTAQSIVAGSTGTVILDSEDFDPNSNFSTVTGGYTVPLNGFYHIHAQCRNNDAEGADATKRWFSQLERNGTIITRAGLSLAATNGVSPFVGYYGSLAASDVIKVSCFNESTSPGTRTIAAGASLTYLEIFLESVGI